MFNILIFIILLLCISISIDANANTTTHYSWPKRQGNIPETTESPKNTNIAHRQLNQNGVTLYWHKIISEVSSWAHVVSKQSLVSVPGAVGFFINKEYSVNKINHYMYGTEFAHIHPVKDGSLHIIIHKNIMQGLIQAGWGEAHPRKPNTLMLYSPRDDSEMRIIIKALNISYNHSIKNN